MNNGDECDIAHMGLAVIVKNAFWPLILILGDTSSYGGYSAGLK